MDFTKNENVVLLFLQIHDIMLLNPSEGLPNLNVGFEQAVENSSLDPTTFPKWEY